MGNSLVVNSNVLADANIQSVQIRPLVGAYELVFSILASVRPITDFERAAAVQSARIAVAFRNGEKHEIGTATSDHPVLIRQKTHLSTVGVDMRLTIQARQLAALEDYRDSGNLNFTLTLLTIGSDAKQGRYDWADQQTLYINVPESTWVEQLKSANALDILLLEIPMPAVGDLTASRSINRHLHDAQKLFVHGNYRECISACRQAAEEIGGPNLTDIFKPLCTARTQMDKRDRENAVLAAIHHYTHLSAHSESRGGTDFNRSDAKFALSMIAAIAAHR